MQPWQPAKLLGALSAGRELLVLRRVGDVVVSEDEKAIQGTWRVETPNDYYFRRDQLVTIAPHTMTLSTEKVGGRKTVRAEYVLDPASQPKRMGLTRFFCSHCIYELQGDRLTLCYFQNPGRNGPFWPTKFAADDKTQARLVVLNRVAEPAAVSDAKAIQGTWEIASSTFSLVEKFPDEKRVHRGASAKDNEDRHHCRYVQDHRQRRGQPSVRV